MWGGSEEEKEEEEEEGPAQAEGEDALQTVELRRGQASHAGPLGAETRRRLVLMLTDVGWITSHGTWFTKGNIARYDT